MSWDNDDMQNLIANAQRAEMIRQQDRQLEELKKQNARQSVVRSEPQEKTFKCPACAEWIKAEAKICKHCRTEVGEHFAAIIAEEKREEQEKKERIEKERARQVARRAQQEREDKDRLAALYKYQEEQRQAKRQSRRERIERIRKAARSKTGLTSISIFLILTIFSSTTFALAEMERQNLEKARQDKIAASLALLEGQKSKACASFSGMLIVLAEPYISNSRLESANTRLSKTLLKWNGNKGTTNLHTKLSSLSSLTSELTKSGVTKENKRLKAFQKGNFENLIELCNLSDRFIYPSIPTVSHGCWNVREGLRAELQARNTNGSWRPLATKGLKSLDRCEDPEYPYSSEIRVNLGLMDSESQLSESYRVRVYRLDGRSFSNGNYEDFSCGSGNAVELTYGELNLVYSCETK